VLRKDFIDVNAKTRYMIVYEPAKRSVKAKFVKVDRFYYPNYPFESINIHHSIRMVRRGGNVCFIVLVVKHMGKTEGKVVGRKCVKTELVSSLIDVTRVEKLSSYEDAERYFNNVKEFVINNIVAERDFPL